MDDTTTTEPRGDDLTLLPNGMIRLVFDDREILLRRPTIGELRARRESLHLLNDELARRAAEAQAVDEARRRIAASKVEKVSARIEEALDADELDEAAVERLYAEKATILSETSQADRTSGRDLNDWIEARRLSWAAATISGLALGGDVGLGEDELPSWITDAGFAPKVIGHWRTVPSRSGGS